MKNDYFEKAAAYLKAKGLKSGDFPVIDRTENKLEWDEWVSYFQYIGLKKSAELMCSGMTRWTVPDRTPRNFDPVIAQLAIEDAAARKQKFRQLSPEDRANIVARARDLRGPT